MKTRLRNHLFIIGLLLFMAPCLNSYGQDTITQKSQMLDMKLQLLDSKLELLDVKIKLWESKPKELDIKLKEIDSKISSMDFDPQLVSKKINEMDSMMKIKQEVVVPEEIQSKVYAEPDPIFIPSYKSAITLDPVRLLEGTFCLSYERIINNRFSANISGMATYSTTQGLSNYYFSNQSFAYYDASSNRYQTYEGEVMSGGGINLQFRNYLLANHSDRHKAPLGLYAAPQIMLRKMKITGNYQELEETDPDIWEMVDKQIKQNLNIFAGGVILGIKVPLFKVLTIDLFGGGNIRLSKYKGEDGFTKYKDWFNIDFSGVSPVAGIAIGILK